MAGDEQKPEQVRTFEYGFEPGNPGARNESYVSVAREHSLSRDRSRERDVDPASAPFAASPSAQSKTEDLIRNGTPDQMVEALRAKREAAESAYEASKPPKGLGDTFSSEAEGSLPAADADEKFTPIQKGYTGSAGPGHKR
jgi:hypothetical protein